MKKIRVSWTATPALIKVDGINKKYMKGIFITGATLWYSVSMNSSKQIPKRPFSLATHR